MDSIDLYNLIPNDVDRTYIINFIDNLKLYKVKEEQIFKFLLTTSLSIPLIQMIQEEFLSVPDV